MICINKGLENEYEIVEALHNRKIQDLPSHFRNAIEAMFPFFRPYNTLWARKVSNFIGCKTDIEISLFSQKINVSIKSGHCPSLHQETLKCFLIFLQTLGVSEETLRTFQFYHYADETYDGTGIKMLRFDDFREKYKEMIAKASEELSQEHIVQAIAYRALIKGRLEHRQEIDYLYYGNKDSGAFFHKTDLMGLSHLTGKREFTSLHFGPFVYVAKVPNKFDENGNKIQYSQIIWPEIRTDLATIYRIVRQKNLKQSNY